MEIGELTRIASLIEKYLRGELSETERKELDCWIENSENHRSTFQRICSEKFLEQWRAEENMFDADKACEHFIREQMPRKRKPFLRWMGYAAAVFVLLLGTTLFLYDKGLEVKEETSCLQGCGSSVARLTLGDGRIVDFSGNMKDTLRQGSVLLCASDGGIEYQAGEGSRADAYNELEVPRKGEFFLRLSDGTKVWLNSETRLRYPVVFSGKERVIQVEGEVYIEVSKDAAHPFIVEMSGRGRIAVTGTSFNVRNYADEEAVRVTLVQGGVRLIAETGTVSLEPGEQGCIVAGQKVDKKKVNVSLYTAWRDGRFVFKEQSLEEIMRTVARWYDVEVEFESEKVRQVTFSGNLKRYDDFGKIIGMLEAIKIARFEINGNCIRVYE